VGDILARQGKLWLSRESFSKMEKASDEQWKLFLLGQSYCAAEALAEWDTWSKWCKFQLCRERCMWAEEPSDRWKE